MALAWIEREPDVFPANPSRHQQRGRSGRLAAFLYQQRHEKPAANTVLLSNSYWSVNGNMVKVVQL